MTDDIVPRIRRIFGIFLTAFLLLLVWQSYWHLLRSDWLLNRQTNRRLARTEASIARGAIFDRHGMALAWTKEGTRKYAAAHATAAVLGYLDPVYGRTGVEGEWNPELSGLTRTFTAADLHRILVNEAPRGKDITLTLDLGLQKAAVAALGDKKGAIAVLDPATGGILALVTSPTFNPITIRADFKTLSAQPDGALRDRATQDLYPPGSTMKVVTASAALMAGVDPATRYTCTGTTRAYGVTITDYHGERHGSINMAQALAESCNNYFAHTAAEMKQQDFFTTAEGFGFGQRWWNKLPDARMLPLEVVKSSLAPNVDNEISQGERAHMGFGQSTVVTTPLQMAMVAAGIANDGTVMAPFLVSQLSKPVDGEEHPAQVLQTFHSVAIGYPVNGDVAKQVAGMMRKVVTSGTARGAGVPGLTVYGKTGTAQQTGGDDHAWFIGFADRERDGQSQRIAFAVLIERGGTGGRVAMPVAKKVLSAWK